MATYNDIVRSKHASLGAATQDVLNFRGAPGAIEVINLDDVDEIFVTVDGSDVVADADGTTIVRPGDAVVIEGGGAQIKMISPGAAEYHVERVA